MAKLWDYVADLYGRDETQQLRRQHPDGLHRLAHLVPDLAPDQPTLARELAAIAISTRASDLEDDIPLRAYLRYQDAKGKPAAITLLAREARSRDRRAWLAWQACTLFLSLEARAGFEWRDGQWHKAVHPIPAPIQTLTEDYFRGDIERPTTRKTSTPTENKELRDDVIRFAVWMALEADISATARPGRISACSIVADLVPGLDYHQVARIWQGRQVKPKRSA